MDFTQLDSRSAADEGRPLHITHPGTGEPMMDGDTPCIVYVLGTEGRIAQGIAKEAAKLPKLAEDATMEDWHERLCQTAERLITRFSGIDRGDRPATRQDAAWFLNLNLANPANLGKGRSFVEQVLRFSGDRSAYLGKPGAVSASPRNKSDGSGHGQTGKRKAAPKR